MTATLTHDTAETDVVHQWKAGDRVAVNSRTCEDAEFAGLVGTVEEVDELGVAVRLDADKEVTYDFAAEELTVATGFMPGATDDQLYQKLAGRTMIYYRDLADDEDTTLVLNTPLARKHFRIERRDDPLFDQVHFLDPTGFRAVYLSNIIGVK